MFRQATFSDYDSFIYDYETTNTSFLAIASLLERKGVKDNAFFLQLYDEDLVGVNPYDPNLSPEMKLKIAYECKRNVWYFIREVMYIPASGEPLRFGLNRGNLAGMWAFTRNINTMLVMPRQFGSFAPQGRKARSA